MTVIAISAAYGARGSHVGPALATALDVPFVDRAIDLRVAGALDVPVDEAAWHWEPGDRGFLERILSTFLGADSVAPVGLPPETASPQDFRRATERAVLEQARTGTGVILGRGAVAALRGDPSVLRVRLSGPAPRRIEQAMAIAGIDESEATARMRRLDRYHAEYLRAFYDVDIEDPALYHLALDATALSTDACVDLIVVAARDLGRAS